LYSIIPFLVIPFLFGGIGSLVLGPLPVLLLVLVYFRIHRPGFFSKLNQVEPHNNLGTTGGEFPHVTAYQVAPTGTTADVMPQLQPANVKMTYPPPQHQPATVEMAYPSSYSTTPQDHSF
jgi:hypothetical protein